MLPSRVFRLLLSAMILVSIVLSNPLDAQKNLHNNFHPFFDHIGVTNGLSGNIVTCMYKDHRGFLWIGTKNGLNEYDGKNITVFRHNRSDSQSIVYNDIHSIAEDDSGYLWLGTLNGISRFNSYNHQSVNYLHDAGNPFSLNDNFKCIVYIDKEKTIWVGNASGLSYFDKKTNRFITVPILPDSLNKRGISGVGAFLEDSQGRFWLGCYTGLILYNRKTHTAQRFTIPKKIDSNRFSPIISLFCDHGGHIWVGAWADGICEFDPGTKSFRTYKWNTKSNHPTSVNIVKCISESVSQNGNYILWVGTTEGLLRINHLPITNQSVDHIFSDPSNSHGLNDNQIACMLADGNILWIGTENGIDQYTASDQLFSNTFLVKGGVMKILVDENKNTTQQYYVSTWYGNGLILFDSAFKPVKAWKTIPPGAKNPDNGQVSDVIRSADGTFWIATFNGLYHFDKRTNRFTSYLHNPSDSNSLSDNRTTSVAEDKDGNLWIGTYDRGIDEFDPLKKTFTHFIHKPSDTTSVCDRLVWNIYIDKQQKMWIETAQGLSLYNSDTKTFTNYTDNDKQQNALKGRDVHGILEDSNGIYWIATNEGLNRFNLQKKQFTLYATDDGLDDDDIQEITKDKDGKLWMCTASGISSFDPDRKIFINYNEQNGLLKQIEGPMITLSDGNILAGGDHLLLKFDPSKFKNSSVPPRVYITQMSVAGKALSFERPLMQSGPVVLHYPQNSFSCSFSAPDFFNGDAVKYAYRLDGIDAKWIQAGTRNFLSYSNLNAGNYVLHIKADNSDGVWSRKDIALKITVLPPFWKTAFFRIAFLLIIIAGIYSLFTYRLNTVRKEEALKTAVNKQMADMRLKVLHTRINPHFIFNALNSIQECIYTQKTDSASKYLSKFSRLLRLVLEQSEQTLITVSEEIEILKLYLGLESLRFDDAFIYKVQEENIESDLLKIPPMLIQPFVENALWHGLRHKKGEKKLTITFKSDKQFIYVTIEDNGIGREQAKAFIHDSDVKKHSLGIKISEDQLQMISSLSERESDIKIEDIFSETGASEGTKVTLTIPVLEKIS